MKIWLDDEPEAAFRAAAHPESEGWIHCRWPAEVIEHLRTGKVEIVSLDHDLGETGIGARNGYDVIKWLEQEVGYGRWEHPLPKILVHSQNNVAVARMSQGIRAIERMYERGR